MHEIVQWAWQVLRSHLCDVAPAQPPQALVAQQAACFVTLHRRDDGQLRGCIGTLAPHHAHLAEEIAANAVAAATRDPRFAAVRCQELEALTLSVDVLSEPEDIADVSALDIKEYGVIVHKGMRRGVLLPDLDGVTSVAQQVAIAKQKAGIMPFETVSLQRFKVVRYTEDTL